MTRDEILEAAVQNFSQKGFHATSMQDIAQSVNLRKASLYHHVSSKQEILVELLDQALDILIQQMQEVSELSLAPDKKLRLAIKEYLTTLISHRDRASVLLLEHRSLDSEYQSRHIPRRDKFEDLWRGIIIEGAYQGTFVCQDPALVTRALLGMINWTITWYKPGGPLSAEQIADEIADLFLGGLLSHSA
jgi:AcrR family transcriptional regulator